MTIKKYLTTPEEMVALKDTDTKIYCKGVTDWYCQFIGGVLCRIFTDKTPLFNVTIDVNGNYYILVEEPVKEADEKDIGKLCKFFGGIVNSPFIGVLAGFTYDRRPVRVGGNIYKKCYRLTPAEVAEITGYKVEE